MAISSSKTSIGLLALLVLCGAVLSSKADANPKNDKHDAHHARPQPEAEPAVVKSLYDYNHIDSWGYNRNSSNLYSPIDIPRSSAAAAAQFFQLRVSKKFDAVVSQNQAVNFVGQFASLRIEEDGKQVDLEPQQIRFRAPGAHHLNGVVFDGEFRFYFNRKGSSNVTSHIVSVMLRAATSDLDSQDVFRETMKSARVNSDPIIYQSAYRARNVVLPDQLRNFFAANQAFYRYKGSLPAPPHTQNVIWYIFEQPLDVSRDDIEFLRSKYSSNKFGPNGGNASPIQPLNGRAILYGKISAASAALIQDDEESSSQDNWNNKPANWNDEDSSSSHKNHNKNDDDCSSSENDSRSNKKHADKKNNHADKKHADDCSSEDDSYLNKRYNKKADKKHNNKHDDDCSSSQDDKPVHKNNNNKNAHKKQDDKKKNNKHGHDDKKDQKKKHPKKQNNDEDSDEDSDQVSRIGSSLN